MAWFRITRGVTDTHGSQVFVVEADNAEDARAKLKAGGGELVESVVEVTQLESISTAEIEQITLGDVYETDEAYVLAVEAKKDSCCPFCHSTQVEGEEVEIEGPRAAQENCCLLCEGSWQTVYTISGFRERSRPRDEVLAQARADVKAGKED